MRLLFEKGFAPRQLVQGHAARVDAKDKATVVALREIAAGVTDRDMLTKVPL
jgi:DNA-directed RNA polymerase subunit omega